MADAVVAQIALGSNLGDRAAMIRSAIDELAALSDVEVTAVSDFFDTDPVGPAGGPQSRTSGLRFSDQPRYLNAAATVRTLRSPRMLLEEMLSIERRLGRDRTAEPRWGPRLIDLDLLLFGDLIIDEPGLTVPHPRMHERRFVLEPLAQVAPDAVHPILGRTVAELWRECRG